jgi:signal transduction histidine kinase/PAS domain-containing protein
VSPTPPHLSRELHARFGAARDGVAVLTSEWRIRYMNASMLEILELIGRGAEVGTLWDVIPAWEHSEAADSLRQCMATRAACCFRVERDPGRGRVWEVHAEPLDAGELRVRVRNVTAQARLEEAERRLSELGAARTRRESRLDALLTHSPLGIALFEASTLRVVEANPFFHTLLEERWREPGSLLGREPQHFLRQLGEEDAAELFRRVRDRGEPVELPDPARPGERGEAAYRWTLKPVSRAPGQPVEFLLLVVVDVGPEVQQRRSAEAERRVLHDVLDTLPVGVIVAEGPEGRTTYINPAGEALAGREVQREPGPGDRDNLARWEAYTPQGDVVPVGELPIARALRGERSPEGEMVLRAPGEAERTVAVSGIPLADAQGGVERGMVALYDLTERLRQERILLERARAAEAAAAEAALRVDEARVLREIGRALVSELEPERVLRLAAQSAMELVGSRASLVVIREADGRLRLHPALGVLADLDGRLIDAEGSIVQPVLASGTTRVYHQAEELPTSSEMRAVAERRGLRNLVLVPLRAFGNTLGVLAAVDREGGFADEQVHLLEGLADTAALALHNVRIYAGEHRRSEETRALLDAAEVLASILDSGEVMRRIVSIAQDLTGADGAGITVFTGEKRERTRMMVAVGALESVAGMEGPSEESVTGIVVAAGKPLAVPLDALPASTATRELLGRLGADFLALVPVRADEGVGLLSVVNHRDKGPFSADQLRVVALLADQAALAVRNALLYERAESASRAKGDFLAIMSHELRTPLNALEGYASLLEEGVYGELNPAQVDALRRMRVSRKHLMEVIDSVLDLARTEAGMGRAHPAETRLDELAESVGEAMRGAAEARGLSLEVDAEGAGTIWTDAGLLRQVLTHLVGNAIKFTQHGGVRVRAWSGAGQAGIEVADTGMGIAPELQQRVFEPFFQVDASTTLREGVSGLGLELAREFVQLMGGELRLESQPGIGSTFSVRLPAAMTRG